MSRPEGCPTRRETPSTATAQPARASCAAPRSDAPTVTRTRRPAAPMVATGPSSTTRPKTITAARSQRCSTSARRWLEMNTVQPSAANPGGGPAPRGYRQDQAVGGLVQEQQAGTAQYGVGEAETLAHPLGVGLHLAIGAGLQPGPAEGLGHTPVAPVAHPHRGARGWPVRSSTGRRPAPRSSSRPKPPPRRRGAGGPPPRPCHRWAARGRGACGWSSSFPRRSARGSRTRAPHRPPGPAHPPPASGRSASTGPRSG
jgi:hypothetical protein